MPLQAALVVVGPEHRALAVKGVDAVLAEDRLSGFNIGLRLEADRALTRGDGVPQRAEEGRFLYFGAVGRGGAVLVSGAKLFLYGVGSFRRAVHDDAAV